MNTPKELKSIFDKFPKEKIELKGERVELAESVTKLLSYTKGVVIFSKNIKILNDEITQAKKSLKADLSDLQSDMGNVAKGIQSAEVAAKLLGVKVNDVPGYSKAIEAIKVGSGYESLAKQLLK
tara:strand:+ start:338 stop:709 length:372 start_codon:yes stop_codon:yes gene_type:complete